MIGPKLLVKLFEVHSADVAVKRRRSQSHLYITLNLLIENLPIRGPGLTLV